MIEIRRILCPIDFSDFSRRAYDHALAIATWYESTITLLHVRAPVPVTSYAPGAASLPPAFLTPQDRDEILAALKRFADTEGGLAVPVEFEVAEGDVAGEIVARSRAMPSDLIVIGTHGRSGFERLVLGSVAERVLRKAECPVLSVPRDVGDAVPASPVLFKRILCPVDFSDSSLHALNYAMSLAQEADAQLTVMHVMEVPPSVSLRMQETILEVPHTLQEYIAAAESDRRTRLQEAVPESVRAYCTVDTVLATGKPYREILRVASEAKSELIVMGIHGRGAADLLFFGSTTQHVVRESTCPVLTLRKG